MNTIKRIKDEYGEYEEFDYAKYHGFVTGTKNPKRYYSKNAIKFKYGFNNYWYAMLGEPDRYAALMKFGKTVRAALYLADRVEQFIVAHKIEHDDFVAKKTERQTRNKERRSARENAAALIEAEAEAERLRRKQMWREQNYGTLIKSP